MTRTPLAPLDERPIRVWALVQAMVDLCRRRKLMLPGKPAAVKEQWRIKDAK